MSVVVVFSLFFVYRPSLHQYIFQTIGKIKQRYQLKTKNLEDKVRKKRFKNFSAWKLVHWIIYFKITHLCPFEVSNDDQLVEFDLNDEICNWNRLVLNYCKINYWNGNFLYFSDIKSCDSYILILSVIQVSISIAMENFLTEFVQQ